MEREQECGGGDLAPARSDVKAEEILLPLLDRECLPLAETVLPGAYLIGDQERSLERVFLHS